MPVVPEFVSEQPSPIHTITLTGRHQMPKIKACIDYFDYWAEWFGRIETLPPARTPARPHEPFDRFARLPRV